MNHMEFPREATLRSIFGNSQCVGRRELYRFIAQNSIPQVINFLISNICLHIQLYHNLIVIEKENYISDKNILSTIKQCKSHSNLIKDVIFHFNYKENP